LLCAECPAQLVVLANAPPSLAEKLVSCALAGEGWAFKDIGDRLEGKPVLTAILRRRIGVVPVQTDEERPEGKTLNWHPDARRYRAPSIEATAEAE
jgi:hypothetical protein